MKFILTSLFIALSLLLVCAAAQAQQSTPLTWTWTDNSNNEDGFRLERRAGQAGAFATVGTTGPNVARFTDTVNDGGGVEYCYRVVAFNAAGVSGPTNIACATSPVIVTIPADPGQLILDFQKALQGLQGFKAPVKK